MPRTAYLTHESFLRHNTGPVHPESADRLRAIWHKVDSCADACNFVRAEPQLVPEDAPRRCHEQQVIDVLTRLARSPGLHHIDADTVVCQDTPEAAYRAIGAGRQAADMIADGDARNAFCAVRPPGHHATPYRSMGFCIFNNVALLARYVQDHHGAKRVLIVDWDVHHGNGTQDIFYADASVMYFSTHQSPHYPGTGDANEKGAGPGEGTVVNVPLRAGAGDAEYLHVFDTVLKPAADRFEPDWVLISAGFDAHRDDPLAGMAVTEDGFAALTDRVAAIAAAHCDGRLISYLEGGYDLDGLADSVVAHLGRLHAAAAA